jgi:hypothetical protein
LAQYEAAALQQIKSMSCLLLLLVLQLQLQQQQKQLVIHPSYYCCRSKPALEQEAQRLHDQKQVPTLTP